MATSGSSLDVIIERVGTSGSSLDDEIHEWEQEMERQQSVNEQLQLEIDAREDEERARQAFNEQMERAAKQAFELDRARRLEQMRELQAKEEAIMGRIFGDRPPTRWAKPEKRINFFAEKDFLRRSPRLSETLFSPARTLPEPPRSEPRLPPPLPRMAHTQDKGWCRTQSGHRTQSPSTRSLAKDQLRQDSKARPFPSFNLDVIEEQPEPDLRRGRGRQKVQEEQPDDTRGRGSEQQRFESLAKAQSVDTAFSSKRTRSLSFESPTRHHLEDSKLQIPVATLRSVLKSRGSSRGESRGESRPGSQSSTARNLLESCLRVANRSLRQYSNRASHPVTPQTPQVARKYGELLEPPVNVQDDSDLPEPSANFKAWGWSTTSKRNSQGDRARTRSVGYGHRAGTGFDGDTSSHVDGVTSASRPETTMSSFAWGRSNSGYLGRSGSFERMVVDEENEIPGSEGTPPIKLVREKLYNEVTGKWKRQEGLENAAKDQEGHGDTVYPRIPQVLKDPAEQLAEALLHAKTSEEKNLILDKVSLDLRPGHKSLDVDYEATVGLVMTDGLHGPMIELIEANSSAFECKNISRFDYVLEVEGVDVRNRSGDEVEDMLIGKEGTTVQIVLQMEHYGKPRAVSLIRKSQLGDLKQAPKDWFRKEEEEIWGCGYNEFGNLNTGEYKDACTPLLWMKKKLAVWDLKGRIHQVVCGWYHTVIVAKQKWTTAKPMHFDADSIKDEEVISTEELATALADWASPKFRTIARRDTELPDDAEQLMYEYPRKQNTMHKMMSECTKEWKEIISMYMRMLMSGEYGSAKKLWCVFTCGLNKSGQLGLGHRDNVPTLNPIDMCIGEKVDFVACGGHHTLMLMQTGAVMSFGANQHGQLGNGSVFDAKSPTLVPSLTHESTRNARWSTPSRILLVTRLEPYSGKADVERNFKTCFGYQHTIYRGSNETIVPINETVLLGQGLNCALVVFNDVLTAAHAMKKFQGKVLGEVFIKEPMSIYYFHPHQSGKDTTAGLQTKIYRSPCLIPVDVYVKQIAAGYDHSMALLSNGQVMGFGHNNWGQIGVPPLAGLDPEIVLRLKELPNDPHLIQVIPVLLPFTRKPFPGEPNVRKPEKVKLMAVGGNHNLFLLEDGRVMACGRNDNRQLGLGPAAGKIYHEVVGIYHLEHYDVRTICAGASHSLAVLYDGRVFSWGRNDSFQCGHYDVAPGENISLPREIEVITKNGKDIVHVTANEHTMVVCGDVSSHKQLFMWGANAAGQLGLAHCNPMFERLEHPPWTTTGIQYMPLTGAFHTLVCNRLPQVSCAHQYENCAYSCGYNKHGELGLGYATESYKQVAVGAKIPSLIAFLHMREIEQVACGWYHTLCIYYDQRDLREGFIPPSSEVAPDDGCPEGAVRSKVAPKPPVKKKEGGLLTSLIESFVKPPPKQHLVGWGYNRRGQLGLGHSESQCKVVTVDLEKWGVQTRITKMCCGGMSSYIVTENRDVFAFGSNAKGQLGNGKIGGREKSPVKIPELSGKFIRLLCAGYDHCFALVGADVYSWGANGFGQLGLGHGENTPTPTHVPALSKLNLSSVACGGQHTIALAKNTVWAMGRNDFGQLGYGTRSPIPVTSPPLEIKFLSRATAAKTTKLVACGASHSLFVLANGELLGCGRNDSGQLGLGHYEEALERPTWILKEQMLNGHQVIGVTAGEHTVVSLSTGEVIGCGANHNGQLGLGHTLMTADFQTLPMDSMRGEFRAGAFHTFAHYGGAHPRRARNASAAAAAVSGVCCIC